LQLDQDGRRIPAPMVGGRQELFEPLALIDEPVPPAGHPAGHRIVPAMPRQRLGHCGVDRDGAARPGVLAVTPLGPPMHFHQGLFDANGRLLPVDARPPQAQQLAASRAVQRRKL
jgi:hypothetical protein